MAQAKDARARASKLSPTRTSTAARSRAASPTKARASNASVIRQTLGEELRANQFAVQQENTNGLGKKTTYRYNRADRNLLQRFANPAKGAHQEILITAPEFTSLCPITGQPDFATIRIRYSADSYCVESKSLKLYLGSFRQYGAFHEAVIWKICDNLVELLNPFFMSVKGEFSPRGGISFHPTSEWSRPLSFNLQATNSKGESAP